MPAAYRKKLHIPPYLFSPISPPKLSFVSQISLLSSFSLDFSCAAGSAPQISCVVVARPCCHADCSHVWSATAPVGNISLSIETCYCVHTVWTSLCVPLTMCSMNELRFGLQLLDNSSVLAFALTRLTVQIDAFYPQLLGCKPGKTWHSITS